MTGITCEEVKQIMTWIMPWIKRDERGESRANVVPSSLAALKSNIIDGQNKLDIIAFVDTLFFQRYPTFGWPMPLEVMVNVTCYGNQSNCVKNNDKAMIEVEVRLHRAGQRSKEHRIHVT